METHVKFRQEHWATISLVMFVASMVSPALAQKERSEVAISLEQQGKTAEAEAVWSGLAKTYPTNPEPLAHLGLLEARQEHYAEAIRFYRKALALEPAMPGLRLNLGL